MAFTEQEKQIIIYGKANGKSQAEVERALINHRTGYKPPQASPQPITETPGALDQIKDAASAGIQKTKEGIMAPATADNPLELIEGGLKAGAGAAETLFSPLAPLFRPVADVFQKLADQIGNIPGIQRFAQSKAGDVTSRVAEDVANASSIAGTLAGGRAAPAAGKAAIAPVAKAASLTGEVFETTADALRGTGRALYKTAITPTAREAGRILAYQSETPFLRRVADALTDTADSKAPRLRADTAFEKGIVGTETMVGVQARSAKNSLWKDTIQPALEGSSVTVAKEDLFAPIRERIAATTEPGRRNALEQAFEAIQEDYANLDTWNLKQAQKLKSEIDTFTPQKMFKGQDVVNEYRTLQHDMANAIRQKTYGALADQNIKQAYLDWANLNELEQIGVKALSEGGFKGGFGSFWSAAWDMTTTPVKTVGGQMLYRVGDMFEFVGEKGLRTFGEYLSSRGVAIPVPPSSALFQQPNTPQK